MRVFAHWAVVGCVAATTMLARTPSAQPRDAASVLAAARQALGGEAKLSAVKSFTAVGRTRQVRGDNLVPIEFEIFVELPDKYVRKDEVPAQESGPTATGFAGNDFLQDPPPAVPPAAPGGAGPNPAMLEAARKGRVTAVKQDFARLTLGMFGASFSAFPMTFSYVGEAEAPQGRADVIDAKGPDNFTIRLFVSQQTHLPIMVSWQGAAAGRGRAGGPMPPGGAPAGRGAAPAGEPARGAPPAGERGAPPAGERGAPPAGERGAPPAGERGAPPAGERGAPPAGEPSRGAPPSAERGAPPAGATPPSGPPPAPGERGAARAGGPAASPQVENRLYFADYREVDGMQFPFRLRRAVGPDTVEETAFDRFKINAKIDPRRFEVRK